MTAASVKLQDGGQSSWKLRPPRAGEKKTKYLEPNKLSLFFGIDYNAYFLDNATIYDIYNASTPKERRRAKWEYENMPYSHILTKMTSTVEEEFTDPFPIARLNYFAIYKVIVNLLRRLANGGHESWCRPECTPTKERAHFEAKYQCGTTTSAGDGANMIVALLEGIDTYVVDEMKTSMLGGYHQLELCKRVFGECMQGKTLEDFIWDI
ncbi:MAG: hypothetical protein M1835_006206 [Candelina submexicana]|nr:MAG: hypothetical protein M1835_006206 [Candelina submexicana]